MPRAERQRLDVTQGGRGERQRAGVLVDAERERRRLGDAGLDPPLPQDAGHRRAQRTVLGDHRAPRPVRGRRAVVVEQHCLDAGTRHDLGQVAQPVEPRRLDHDHPRDRGQVAPRRVRQVELVLVQRDELADVAVEAAVQQDPGARVQPPRRQHRPERVEVGGLVPDDDLGGAHPPSLCVAAGGCATATRR